MRSRVVLLPSLLSSGLLLSGTAAWGLASVSITETLFSVDPSCDQPIYLLEGTATATSDDDGLGNDYLAVVVHDGSGNYIDVDYRIVQGAAEFFSAEISYVGGGTLSSFHSSRPITVRVHDIPDPGFLDENSKAGLELASASSSVLAQLIIDPANDAAACSKPFGDSSLRIERLTNGGAQSVTTTPANMMIGDGGITELTMASPGYATLAVFYRAECVLGGADNLNWIDVDLRVDGTVIPPTHDGGDAFCSSNGTNALDGWVMPRISGVAQVAGPAVHTVEVLARSTAGTGALSDSELIVMLPEPSGRWGVLAGVGWLGLLARRRARALRGLLGAGAVLALTASAGEPVRAGTVLESTENSSAQTFAASDGRQLLELSTGSTSFQINLVRDTRLAILFTAECAVNAGNSTTWLDLDIRVDGVDLINTDDSDDAFCTSHGPGLDNWVSPAIHATADLTSGLHTIEVEAGLQNSGSATDSWRIDDISVIAIGQEY